MRFLYAMVAHLLVAGMYVAALFTAKARKGISGRVGWRSRLASWRINHPGELIWMHCSSLGEFEQGRSLLEEIRLKQPEKVLLLTFFSPSGYEIRKDTKLVDGVFYLPWDTSGAAADFFDILKPKIALFIKYEYWPNFFFAARKRDVPLFVVSAIFRKNQRFFRLFGGFWRDVLRCVSHFFVQNESSEALLMGIGMRRVTVAGDTRFDRVIRAVETAVALPEMIAFRAHCCILMGGSTWPADEHVLRQWLSVAPEHWKLVIVPHEVDAGHLNQLKKRFPMAVCWSERNQSRWEQAQVLIVDTIGLLSGLYRYADICWIGGGFGAGIHNTLEAAAWGKSVAFGPNYVKFDEAVGLIGCGAAVAADSPTQAVQLIMHRVENAAQRQLAGQAAERFVRNGGGATGKILSHLVAE